MKNKRELRNLKRRGAMLPLIGVVMVLLFVAAVFAIDLARVHVTRSELRTATDAAARAAVEALGRTESESEAVAAALRVARANTVAGEPLNLDRSKILFGSAEPNSDGSFTFTDRSDFSDSSALVNSVRVIGERVEGSPDGPVNTMFGKLFGQNNFQPIQSATAARLDRDIALILDKSGSMVLDNRYQGLLDGVTVFAATLEESTPKERVSVVAYDTNPKKLLDLTDELFRVREVVQRETAGGLTGIGNAMRVGIRSVREDPLARSIALKSMVVMTDGNHNFGVSPLVVAREAKRQNIVVHTITFSNGANQTLMRQVAEATGGVHLHATDSAELSEAFSVIARQLQVLLIE